MTLSKMRNFSERLKISKTSKNALVTWLVCGVAVSLSVGCGSTDEADDVSEQSSALGESTPAYYFGGEGSESMPDYAERAVAHVLNLARRQPEAAGITGPLPQLPAVVDPYFTEMARWQGRHVLESSCVCNSEDATQLGRSCCELGMVDGELACAGEVVACDASSGTTSPEERWSFFDLALGVPAVERSLTSESAEPAPAASLEAQALGFANAFPEVLSGQHQVMGTAVVRTGEENYLGWVGGLSARALPAIADGVHLNFGADSAFGATPEGEVSFSMIYVEPNGAPSQASVVMEDGCQAMDLPSEAEWTNRNEENPIAGGLARLDRTLEAGCHRYVFAAVDTYGVGHTYPTYGSLGAEIGEEGQVLANSEACPVWSAERPSMGCLEPAQSCGEGDERVCYSGRAATREAAACQAGVERCEAGWWTGECDGESSPDATERCNEPEGDSPEPSLGENSGESGADDEGCGCASSGGATNFGALLLLGIFACAARVRRRVFRTSPAG